MWFFFMNQRGGIGADGQNRQAKATVFAARFAEDFPIAPGRIGNVVDLARRRLDDERGPQRHATIEQTAGGPVIGRLEMDEDALPKVHLGAPIEDFRADAICRRRA